MSAQSSRRFLFFGFNRSFNQEALRRALARERPEHLCLIARSNFLGDLADEFVREGDGFRGLNFSTNTFRAFPSTEFLRAMASSEAVVLRMYERIFRGLATGGEFELRKRLYLEHVAWSYGFLREHACEELVFFVIPHHPFAFTLFSVARQLGLRTRFFAQVQMKDTYVVSHSIEVMFRAFGREYARMREAGELAPLEGRLQREFDRRSGRHKPFYMSGADLGWRGRAYRWTKKNLRPDSHLRVHRTVSNAFGYWRARRPLPPSGERFVYFPLHLQPEATTSPMGGVFVDQYLAIEMLARALPPGWKVVVKENPAQAFAKRDLGFYEQLARTPQVHLVSRSADTFDLMERCSAVASITGTAGWEALFRGKPAIAFGRAFYRDAPGCIAVESFESLRSALQDIADERFAVCDTTELQRFVGAVGRRSFEGVVDPQYLRDSDLAAEDCLARHASMLEDLIAGREPDWLCESAGAPLVALR